MVNLTAGLSLAKDVTDRHAAKLVLLPGVTFAGYFHLAWVSLSATGLLSPRLDVLAGVAEDVLRLGIIPESSPVRQPPSTDAPTRPNASGTPTAS
jgi:predicted amidohydrolase